MNVVYLITFKTRKAKGLKPFMYIGSKSNCELIEGKLIDKNGKHYIGSSSYKDYFLIAEKDELQTEILSTHETYEDAIKAERSAQIQRDVVVSDDYFNMHLAAECTYAHPDYKTMKNIKTGKTCRLTEDQITDDWVGTTSGYTWFTNGKIDTSALECPDGFWPGRSNSNYNSIGFTKESHAKSVETRKKNGSYVAHNKGVRGLYSHTDEAKAKMKMNRPDQSGAKNGMFGKIVINNGIENARIMKDEPIPDGWVKGMLKKKKAIK